MKFNLLYVLVFFLSINLSAQDSKPENFKKHINWWMKEKNDSLASSDILKLFNRLSPRLKTTKQKVVIAVLDADVDIYHKRFKDFLWLNKYETAKDSLDNDNNGYIDDLHGWNFLGTKKDGSSLEFTLIEETRILRKFSKEEITQLYKEGSILFSYDSVKKSYDNIKKSLIEKISPYKAAEAGYVFCMDTLRKTFQHKKLNLEIINTLQSKDTIVMQPCINYVKQMYEDDYPFDEFTEYLNYNRKALKTCLNLNYDNRVLVGDDIYDICDSQYGSPIFSTITPKMEHGTEVSGVIINALTSIQDNYKISLPIKIMPSCITGNGDPTDKDTALAIRYAVDNGAKVINLSQTKSFSINKKFVDKALKYAEKKDVLIVKSAGNEGLNLDEVLRFPNDNNKKGEEFIDNMIVVSGSTKFTNKNIFDSDYNYGKKNVDVFAPGIDISTFSPSNNYTESSGTSYSAPIVATIAALLRSYFPNLSAKQVKQILMDSGTSYNVNIPFKQKDGSEKMIPFSELSKSGKVVNAYNAFIMAEKIARK